MTDRIKLKCYRIDHAGINAAIGKTVYWVRPQEPPECNIVPMSVELPSNFNPWTHEDGTAYCNTSDSPRVSGCQVIYDNVAGRVLLIDTYRRQQFAAKAIEVDDAA